MSHTCKSLRLWAACSLLFLCGCAVPRTTLLRATFQISTESLRQVKPDEGHALVFVYRVWANNFGRMNVPVRVNGIDVGELAINEYVMTKALPGPIVVECWGNKLRTVVQSGGTQYFKFNAEPGSVEAVTETEGLSDISQMKSIVSLDQIPVVDTPPITETEVAPKPKQNKEELPEFQDSP